MTSRGWSVSPAASPGTSTGSQGPRPGCCSPLRIRVSVVPSSCLPRRPGNTSGLPPLPSVPRGVEDLDGPAAQRPAVRAERLHASGGDSPHVGLRVHLGPLRPTHLAGTSGRCTRVATPPPPARCRRVPSEIASRGRRPAHASRETLLLERRDVVAPAHHEFLDLAPVVRRRQGGAVSMVASGPRPGPSLEALAAFSHLLRSGQIQPERPRGADPGVTPWFHALGQKRVVRSGVAQVLSTIWAVAQTGMLSWLKCLFQQFDVLGA